MKQIYYESLYATNVRCHTEISMDFPVGQLYMITGKNGNGKSTIYKAISMVLYGDDGSAKGDRSNIEEMVNAKVGKNLSIIFKFKIINEDSSIDQYRVEAYCKHVTHRDSLYLYKNDIDISGETKTETKKMISKILYPRDVYHTVILFNQQVKDFFTALNNSQQKEIFDAILDLYEYDVSYNLTDQKIKATRQKINDAKAELVTIEKELSSLDSLIRHIENEKITFELNKVDSIKTQECQIEEQSELEHDLRMKISKYPDYHSKKNSLVEKKSKLLSDIAVIESDIKNLNNKLNQDLENGKKELTNELQRSYLLFKELKHTEVEQAKLEIDELISVKQSEINSLSSKYNIGELNDSILSVRSDESVSLKKIDDSMKSEFTEIENEIDSLQKEQFNKSAEYSLYISVAREQDYQIQRNLQESRSKLDKVKSDKQKAIDKEKINYLNEISSLNLEIDKLTNSISTLQFDIDADTISLSAESPLCPKCKRALDDEHKKLIRIDIENSKLKMNELVTATDIKKKKLKEISKLFDEYKIECDKSLNEIDALINEAVSNCELERTSKTKQINDFERVKTEIEENSSKLVSQLRDRRRNGELKISAMKDSVEKESSKRILELRNEIQKLTSEKLNHENRLTTEINGLKSKRTNLDKSVIDELNSKQLVLKSNFSERLSDLRSNLEKELQLELENKNHSIIELNEKILFIDNEISIVDNDIWVLENLKFTLQTIEFKISSIESDILNLTNKKFDDSQLIIKKSSYDLVQSKFIDCNTKTKNSEREEEILLFWKECFSDRGIKSMLIDSAIPFINRNWNRILNEIVPGMFTVSMDTLSETKSGDIREKFSINILHNIKGTNQFKLLSGGEKRIIDLSIMRVLRELAADLYQKRFHVSLNDEILDSLDDENAESFCRLLKQVSVDEHVSIITHNMAEYIEADQRFTI